MKKEDLLKLGLDEETATKVEAESLKELKDYTSKEEMKNYVPKARFDEVNGEKKTIETTIKERDTQLETLKNSTGDIEKLKADITELQAANTKQSEDHAAEILNLKVNNNVDAELTGAKAKNLVAVRALLDLKDPKLDDDGKVKGLADQIKKLKEAEETKFLFDTDTKKKPEVKGAKPAESGNEPPDDNVDTSKMTYEELAAYMEENPDAQI